MDKCNKCLKVVYINEKCSVNGTIWHKICLKCSCCNISLNPTTVNTYHGVPYCRNHYPKFNLSVPAECPPSTPERRPQSDSSCARAKRHSMFVRPSYDEIDTLVPQVIITSSDIDSPCIFHDKSNCEVFDLDYLAPYAPDASKRVTSLKIFSGMKSEGSCKYFCIRNYSPKMKDEIEIKLDDVVIAERVYDDGWAMGLNVSTDKRGIFPFTYLKEIKC